MIDITCKKLTMSYSAEKILDKIDFTINEYEKVALIGLNGSGKTTLFNILTSRLDYDNGTVFVNKSKKLGYLKQIDDFSDKDTIYSVIEEVFKHIMNLEGLLRSLEAKMSNPKDGEDVALIMEEYSAVNDEFEKLDGYSYQSRIKGVLNGLGFKHDDFSKNINKLSGGQKNRVMLAKLLLTSPDILLLDEPTNHLDIKSVEWLEKFIKDYKGTVLLISHDRYFLDSVTSKTLFLNNKHITQYNGNYSYFINKRSEELELQRKKYIIQEKEIQRQKEIIAKFLSNGRDKKVKQAKSREKMLQNIQRVEKPEEENNKISIRFTPGLESGNDVLFVNNLSKSFDDEKVFENIDFNIYKGDKIGLIGPNGVGKSTLVKIITGQLSSDSGEYNFGHNVNIGYFDQELSGLNPDNSVLDEIWDEYPRLKVHEVRGYLARFNFFNDDLFKTIDNLSGGEKSRLSLLKLMLSNTNFIVMDEPTNHLDIDSKDVLEKTISDYTGTILVISHDRYFLNKIVTKIFDMDSMGITEYLGDYDYYYYKKNMLNMEEEPENRITKTELKNNAKKEREIIRERQRLKKKIEEIEASIVKLEEEISELEGKLCLPEVYNDHIKAKEVNDNLENLKSQLEDEYYQWEECQNSIP
ncbi:ATP-binding cassette, subfamily F, member 3 [Dethiosulfatibacter aminovorans DSM 17477]|uniref:ATP-binding cassette, subfamily F, member 3 n=1 Tax=Dethiosulfatibacter aminovorans DSM 17477 TaxID=1121476 RepID=A0A1M6DPH0_9FIRM|nr:ABC-F family ATP-binding cassette domain-containing protein [Dethiosulfatibacter aminovorans]SHI75154.1 ATP-binding cassette, subfamily F, member 3 [Dethiosulfatibacter aminovorans DSM 17477]